MVDKVALKELRDFVASGKAKFDMASILLAGCGSAGCIFGHAAALWPEVKNPTWNSGAPYDQWGWDVAMLKQKLQISHQEYKQLGFADDGGWNESFLENITREMAVAQLDRMLEGKEIEWPKVVFEQAEAEPEL